MSEERYRIEGKIGRGGIGAVYRAFDEQLGRQVAIKRVLPQEEGGEEHGASQEDVSGNLLKEAKVLSTLNHPNIVTVFDVGADAKGVFVVMELLDGETLDETIDRGVLALGDFEQVVVQSLEAMIAAQDIDLVHRDLKPSNVMVVWLPSGKFQLKILDFGLAKFSELPSVQTSDQGDAIMGSIFFMAPEQFERGELDARTDMYSLGCIYYHCLTGKHPFQGDTAAQVMASHLQNRMAPLEKYRPDLPLWVCNWVKWLLQRDIRNRPVSAQFALDHFMNESVGLAELQATVDAAAAQVSAGVQLVGAPVRETTGVQVVVATAAAPPPNLVVAAPVGAAGAAGVVPVSTYRPPSSNPLGKWIALGISALAILGIGAGILFKRIAETRKENWFAEIIAEEVPYGDELTVRRLLGYLDAKYDNLRRDATVAALSRMDGDEVDAEIMAQLENFSGVEQAALLKCLTIRDHAPAVPAMVRLAANSPSEEVRSAALNGVQLMGRPENLGALLDILGSIEDKETKDRLVRAIIALARSVEDDDERTSLLLRRLEDELKERKSLVMVLGALGGEPTLAKFRDVLQRPDVAFHYEVLTALMNWPDGSAAQVLQKLAEETEDGAVRLAAARAYIRLIGLPSSRSATDTEEMFDVGWSLVDDNRDKARIFPVLSSFPQQWASDYAGKYLEDKVFKQMAKRTQSIIEKKIGEVKPLVSGEMLSAATAQLGGTFEAVYEEKTSHQCITNWRDPGTWVFWNFRVEKPGTYSVKLTQACEDSPGSGYEVIVGENSLPGVVRDTRGWTRFVDVELGEVELPEPGIYTLTVKPRGAAKKFIMNLRGVTLSEK